MARIGRPPSCECDECARCERRKQRREEYQAMSLEERRELIARRDPETVRRNDRARYERDREKRRAAMREYAERNPDKLAAASQRWNKRNPEKKAATIAVNNALRDGRLIRQPCEECGAKNAQAHHDDYSKPLSVRWLCPWHHAQHHKRMREQERFQPPTLTLAEAA